MVLADTVRLLRHLDPTVETSMVAFIEVVADRRRLLGAIGLALLLLAPMLGPAYLALG